MSKTALVTGGNRGLGLETGRQLVAHGWRVLLASRSHAEGEKAAQSIGAEPVVLDVSDAQSMRSLAAKLVADGVRLDALVNNAGIWNDNQPERTLEVNTFGALRVTDALLSSITDGGNVVMVSSGLGQLSGVSPELAKHLLSPALDLGMVDALLREYLREVKEGREGRLGWPSSAYNVSKVGMNAFVRVLAPLLWKQRGIRMNAVCPGWVRTDMGGKSAPRSLEEGGASIVWATMLTDETTGGFYRDGQRIDW